MYNRLLRVSLLVALMVGCILTIAPVPTHAQDACPPKDQFVKVEAEFIELLNLERAKTGAQPLSVHLLLTQAAALHSQDMVDNQYFDHTGLDGSTPSSRAQQAGYADPFVAENIAINSELSALDTLNQWLGSAGHRRNMLNPEFNLMGLGMACGSFEGFPNYIYYTQMLGQGEVPQDGHGGGFDGPPDAAANGAPDATAIDGAGSTETVREFVTTDGSELSFGDDALIVTFPKGWRYFERKATPDNAPQVDFQNEPNTVWGLISFPVASELGVTDKMDLGDFLVVQAKEIGQTVAEPTPITTADGYKGSQMVVSGKFGLGVLFVISQLDHDRIIYGEFYGLQEVILDNTELPLVISSIRVKSSKLP